jgi:DNA polymerase
MAKNYGMVVPDAEIKEAVKAWRESRPQTVALWKMLERAAVEAVQKPGVMTEYNGIRFKKVGKFLLMRLPSNRLLYYFDAHIEQKAMPWLDDDGNPVFKDVVAYWGVDSKTKKWQVCYGYGGLWTENAVQAIARDLMAAAMLNLEAAGYPVVLSVHDEVLADVPEGHGSVEDFEKIMCTLPEWAAGLPVNAEGWQGARYAKK